jgi:hypothetical protein
MAALFKRERNCLSLTEVKCVRESLKWNGDSIFFIKFKNAHKVLMFIYCKRISTGDIAKQQYRYYNA